MIRVAICDDDKNICEELEDLLDEFKIKNMIGFDVDIFYKAGSLLKHISNDNRFDIIFMDIEMDGINGIQAGKIIRKNPISILTIIIYISSHKGYAMELFDIKPFNFILKPLDKKKVLSEFSSALKIISKDSDFYAFKSKSQHHQVLIQDILYFESYDRKIKIVTATEIYEFYDKLSEVKRKINNSLFILIHRSILVNFNHIRSSTYENVKMSNGTILPISQLKRKNVRNIMYMTNGVEDE